MTDVLGDPGDCCLSHHTGLPGGDPVSGYHRWSSLCRSGMQLTLFNSLLFQRLIYSLDVIWLSLAE